jgi:hypothetical protein
MREQRTSAGETIVRLLEGGNLSAILRFGSEADLVEVLQHPATAIACDCGASLATRTHPRYYGTFPRVLGRYVRETQALTWEDAVRKMTALPASTIGAIDRGILAAGMAADVTIFDPLTVIDHATYDEPARLSDGIRDVIVNGQIALRDGTPTGVRGGRALTRTAHMPSRPLSLDRERSVAFSGSLATGRISLSVSQKAGARTASGILRLDDAQAGMHLRMAGFGVLQSAEGWASFTGTGRTAARGPAGCQPRRGDPRGCRRHLPDERTGRRRRRADRRTLTGTSHRHRVTEAYAESDRPHDGRLCRPSRALA